MLYVLTQPKNKTHMTMKNMLAAATLMAALTATAQAPQYVIIQNPEIDLKELKVDKEGYYVLFDGTSLNGWRGYCKDHIPGKWNLKDGCLHFNGRGEGEGGDIIFTHQFQNFEFEVEWKVCEGGNSGIFYLGKESATIEPAKDETVQLAQGPVKGTFTVHKDAKLNYQPIYISCPECQVLDNERHPDAKLGATMGIRQSTSLYDMIVAKPQNAKPAGEWNKVKITVKNGKVAHYQNGVKVLSYQLWGDEWEKLLQSSKFSQKNWPLAYTMLKNCGGEGKCGYFGFQDHGDEVWYRNIRVKVLK
ncbi:MAG: DUF1080 domain-containing protein [Bacteroidaceae bacterium]|nr:DUF1080 domain-containing protein [Bacteroidaceae bacterium]